MSELASRSQLRMSLVRWALLAVPLIVLLGFLSGTLSDRDGGRWFDSLKQPAAMPPDAMFGIAWAILYALQGLAAALVLNARGARWRTPALVLFAVQLALNLAWPPLFFGAHAVSASLILILAVTAAATATTFAFGRVRILAAWLMVPYLVWLCFATVLNWRIDQLNPDAERLAPAASGTQILL